MHHKVYGSHPFDVVVGMVITIHTISIHDFEPITEEYINHRQFTRLSKQMLSLFVLSALDYMIINGFIPALNHSNIDLTKSVLC